MKKLLLCWLWAIGWASGSQAQFRVVAVQGSSPAEVRVQFSGPADLRSLDTLSNFGLDGGVGAPVARRVFPDSLNTFRLRFATRLVPGQAYQLRLRNVRPRGGAPVPLLTFAFTFRDGLAPRPDTVTVANPTTTDVQFDEAVDNRSLAGATFTLAFAGSPPTAIPVATRPLAQGAVRQPGQPQQVRIIWDKDLPENRALALTINGLRDSTGNVVTNRRIDFTFDTRRPAIDQFGVLRPEEGTQPARQVRLRFSERVDRVTAAVVNHYQLSGGGQTNALPTQIAWANGDSTVLLTFAQPFQPNTPYSLRVSQVQDLSRNVLTTRTLALVYDPTPPELTGWRLWNWPAKRQIELRFSEPLQPDTAQVRRYYELTSAALPGFRANPQRVSLCPTDPTLVYLQWADTLQWEIYTLTINNLRDAANNPLPQALQPTLDLRSPQITECQVLGPTTLRLAFTRPPRGGGYNQTTSYQLSDGANPTLVTFDTVGSAADRNALRLRFARPLAIGQNEVLSASLPGGLTARQSFVYQTYINTIFAESSNLLVVDFAEDVPLDSLLRRDRYRLRGLPGGQPTGVSRVNDDLTRHPRRVRLLFSQAFRAGPGLDTLVVRGLPLACERYLPQSVLPFSLDNQPPRLLSLKVLSANQLRLTFSKPLHPPTAEGLSNYVVTGPGLNGRVAAADLLDSQTEVAVRLPARLRDGGYTLRLQGLRDATQRYLLRDTTVVFSRPAQPRPGQLLLNEILADPEPVVGLPPAEFVEIFNPSPQTFDLTGLRLADATTSSPLPEYRLAPGGHLVLCPLAAVDSFRRFTPAVLGLSPWPSLGNTSDELRLLALDSNVVDRVSYSSAWITDPAKRGGGWSLELISPANPCRGQGNWAASNDPRGGTPGQPNSVLGQNPDRRPPQVAGYRWQTARQLQLDFTEPPDSVGLVNPANYAVDGLARPSVRYVGAQAVQLQWAAALDSNQIYRLIISNLQDCAGNLGRDTLAFGLGRRALPGEVRFTEIMANEVPGDSARRAVANRLPEAEYVEIFNSSNKLIALGSLQFDDGGTPARLPTGLLPPGGYLVLTSPGRANWFAQTGGATGLSGFPSLANSGETLTLRDTAGWLLHTVSYTDAWYRDARKQRGGWALEVIDPTNDCAEADNWRASQDTSGGTPARANSVRGRLPDTQRPQVASWNLRSERQLEINFSENLDTLLMRNPAFYRLNNGLAVANVRVQNQRRVWLNLSQALANNRAYTLQISDLRDCAGNLLIPFSATLGTGRRPRPGELLITEIMARPQPGAGSPARSPALPLTEYVEVFNPTADVLSLSGVRLQDGPPSASGGGSLPSTFIGPGQYMVLCATSQVDSLARLPSAPRVLAVGSFPSLNDQGEDLSLTINGLAIHAVAYRDTWYRDEAKRQGGWALELIDPANRCGEADNWRASQDPSGGTPGRPNSVLAPNPDTIPPRLVAVQPAPNDPASLRVEFSERMDSLTVVTPGHYALEPTIAVQSVVWQNARTVRITLGGPLAPEQVYALRVREVRDCAGNRLPEATVNFGLGAEPQRHELLITEIMADPSPVVGLPEVEYLELHNPTNRLLQLGGVRLLDDENRASGGLRLPPAVLRPGAYLLLAGAPAAAQLSARFPDRAVLAVPNFPSLNNAGESLELRNANLLFSVTYSDDWYGDAAKRNGGWSLEMIDPANPCGQADNWTASVAPAGGTPGLPNSVRRPNPDRTPPVLLEARAESPTQLRLRFSEGLDSASTLVPDHYQLPDGPAIVARQWLNPQEVGLTLAAPLQPGRSYRLLVRDLRDCAQNQLASTEVNLGLGVAPARHGLLLTELMVDPSPVVNLPESEYVELYNASDNILEISQVMIWLGPDNPRAQRLPAASLLPGQYALLCPLAAAPEFRRRWPAAQVLGLPNWLALPNAGARLELRTSAGRLVHDVPYTDRWYRDPEKRDGGWALEMRDPTAPCAGPENWEASQHPDGGTPGRRNSLPGRVQDIRPPQLLRAELADSLTLVLYFSERLDSASALAATYRVEPSVGSLAPSFSLAQPQQVRLRLGNVPRLRQTYQTTVGNLASCAGNVLFASAPVAWVRPEPGLPGDLIINEILFNPPVGGVDFVELYNRSDKFINLQNWRLSNFDTTDRRLVTDQVRILPPRRYLALTPEPARLAQQYTRLPDSLVLTVNLPSFNDQRGSVRLYNPAAQLVDRFDYDQDMHFRLLDDRAGVSLERIRPDAPTQERANWHSAAGPAFGTPGRPNSQASAGPVGALPAQGCFRLENEIFTPDGDGWQDLLFVHFDCPSPGVVATIQVFDAQGRPVRQLLNQQTLAPGAFLAWDGLTDQGQKARTGYYLLQVELFNLNGGTQRLQLKAVVGAKF
ncbi:MAG: lamin tail domain-containing protein [Bernardetiaceae bacterium]|nr:lamin tail domain-containing protein [Bernardetiaceae bacterium]